jgi:hypothetical protein
MRAADWRVFGHTIPADNLDQLRLHLEHLLPTVSGLFLADKDPVLGVEVRKEPRRHGYSHPSQ